MLLGNLHAAGIGINLTAGTHVVFNDLDWVPGNHWQAEDRIYRIGQLKPAFVTYLVAENTLDDFVAALLEQKARTIGVLEDEAADRATLLDQVVESAIRGETAPRRTVASARARRGECRPARRRARPARARGPWSRRARARGAGDHGHVEQRSKQELRGAPERRRRNVHMPGLRLPGELQSLSGRRGRPVRCGVGSGRSGSNRRHPAWKAGALPTELRPRCD